MSKQEPVAYVTGFHNGHCVIEPLDRATVLPVGMALYRAKEWVGMTDEDEIPWDGVDAKSFARAIESKLKEKNT